MRIALVFLLALSFWSCGSEPPAPRSSPSSDGAGPASAAEPRSLEDSRPVIVTFGDSLTAGFGVEPGKSYPDFLQRELDKRGYSYRVVNEGVSGDTTAMGLARVEAVLSHKPEIVVLCLGGNDGLRALPVDQMKSNLKTIVSRLQQEGIEVVLAGMRLPPNYGKQYTEQFARVYTELAEELDVVFLPFMLRGVWDEPSFMQSDGIHPSVEGNKRLAMSVFEVLEPLLKAPAGTR